MSVGLWLYVNSFCNIKFSHSKCEISNPEFEMLAIIREIELTVCVFVCVCVCVCGYLSGRDYVMECVVGCVGSKPVRRVGFSLPSTVLWLVYCVGGIHRQRNRPITKQWCMFFVVTLTTKNEHLNEHLKCMYLFLSLCYAVQQSDVFVLLPDLRPSVTHLPGPSDAVDTLKLRALSNALSPGISYRHLNVLFH